MYNQLRQNHPNNDFRVEVGKKLPNQFPEPPPVGKFVSVILYFFLYYKDTRSRNYLKNIEGGSMSVICCLINCQHSESPVGNFGGADCNSYFAAWEK